VLGDPRQLTPNAVTHGARAERVVVATEHSEQIGPVREKLRARLLLPARARRPPRILRSLAPWPARRR
jgi:hypothetical protein